MLQVLLPSLGVLPLLALLVWATVINGRSDDASDAASTTSSTATSTRSTSESATSRPPPVADDGTVVALSRTAAVTIPESWENVLDALGYRKEREDGHVVWVGQAGSPYVHVWQRAHADFSDFDDFVAQREDRLAEKISVTGRSGDARPLTIGGLPAMQYQLVGLWENNGKKRLTTWYTLVDGEFGYYEVVGVTEPADEERDQAVITEVIESFREVDVATGG